MKALVLGATGAVGKDLTALLLDDPLFEVVEVFVRRDLELAHPKLVVHVVDFDKPHEWRHLVIGDVAFSCMGTTLKAAGSQAAQYKVDFTYQYEFAKIAYENGVSRFLLVSSVGADAHSRMFYTRMKGELEERGRKFPFHQLNIVRPPALVRKDTDRLTEKLSLPVIRFFNRLGLFRRQAPMPTLTVAKALVAMVHQMPDNSIVTPQQLRQMAMESTV